MAAERARRRRTAGNPGRRTAAKVASRRNGIRVRHSLAARWGTRPASRGASGRPVAGAPPPVGRGAARGLGGGRGPALAVDRSGGCRADRGLRRAAGDLELRRGGRQRRPGRGHRAWPTGGEHPGGTHGFDRRPCAGADAGGGAAPRGGRGLRARGRVAHLGPGAVPRLRPARRHRGHHRAGTDRSGGGASPRGLRMRGHPHRPRWRRGSGRAARALRLRDSPRAPHARHAWVDRSRGPATHEAHRLPGQHRPRADGRHRRPDRCPAERRDRRRRARRDRSRAAARGPSAARRAQPPGDPPSGLGHARHPRANGRYRGGQPVGRAGGRADAALREPGGVRTRGGTTPPRS